MNRNSASGDRGNRQAMMALAAVLVATAAVYLPTLTNGFVGLDDDRYITANPLIRSLSAANLKAILLRPYAEFYHPVTLLSLAFDRAVWEFNPFGYHLTDLLLHLLNTVLVFWLGRELVRIGAGGRALAASPIASGGRDLARTVAVVAAALFALHPLHVESVAWAAQRKDLLCAFFYLLALVFYLRHAKEEPHRTSRLSYRLSLTAFVLALLSKSMAVTLPATLVLLDYYPLRRLRSWPGREMSRDERGVWLEKVAFLGLALAMIVASLAAQRLGGALRSGAEIPWSLRPWIVAHSYAFYLGKAVIPRGLTILYPIADVRPINALPWVCLAVLAVVTVVAWLQRRRWPVLTACWAYYLITLAPVCGLLSFGAQSVADRYSYLPLLGPFLLVGVLAGRINQIGDKGLRPTLRALAGAGMAIALVGCGYLSNRQVAFWHDGESLWRRHLEVYPDSARAHYSLGYFYHAHGRVGEAMQQYEECLRIRPDYFDANINIGSLLLGQGDPEAASEYFGRALDSRPEHAGAHNNMGLALARLGRLDEALEHFKLAVKYAPDYAEGLANLGQAHADAGNAGLAIKYFERALAIDPRMAQVHENLGLAYLTVGWTSKARREFTRTIHLRPRSPGALLELGRLDRAEGHPGRALEHLSRAARCRPRDPQIQLAMAEVVWEQGLLGLAESSLRHAIEIDPDCVEAYFRLGLLLEQKQRYREALDTLTEAWVILQWEEGVSKPEGFDEALRRVDAKVKELEPQE